MSRSCAARTDVLAESQPELDRQTAKGKIDLGKVVAGLMRCWPKLDLLDQRLSLKLYRLLAQGEPVSTAALARETDIGIENISQILGGWPGVFFDAQGKVVGFWGLAVPAYESPHRFTIGARRLSAWCAWDTLFLPQLLGQTAKVESASPVFGETVSLTVTPERVDRVDPTGVHMSFLMPDAAAFQKNVVTAFCHFVHFFASRHSGESWVAQRPGTFLVSIEEAQVLAHRRNEALYSGGLSIDSSQTTAVKERK